MTFPYFFPWVLFGLIALAVSISSLCQPSRRAIWALFWLGLAAILLHEGLERFSGWMFANARVGHAFEQWLAAAMRTWEWYVASGFIFTPFKALVMMPLLAWALCRDAALAPKEEKTPYTHQYTAEDCPGRPCGDGCDHRGLPPKETK